MGLEEVGWECIEWIALAQDRERWWAVVNAVMNLLISMKCRIFYLKTVSYLGRTVLHEFS
jgi:hypothetical protein